MQSFQMTLKNLKAFSDNVARSYTLLKFKKIIFIDIKRIMELHLKREKERGPKGHQFRKSICPRCGEKFLDVGKFRYHCIFECKYFFLGCGHLNIRIFAFKFLCFIKLLILDFSLCNIRECGNHIQVEKLLKKLCVCHSQ